MKNKKKPKKMTRGGVVAMCVFATPFLLWGFYSAWHFLGKLAEHSKLQSWIEAPANIENVELVDKQQGRSAGRRKGRGGTMHKVVASYAYQFDGKHYRGDRVSLYMGNDGNIRHHHRIYRQLQTHIDERRPFRCFVNPDDPQQAVLYREWRWNVSGVHAAHAVVFGGLGLFLLGSSLYYWRKTP